MRLSSLTKAALRSYIISMTRTRLFFTSECCFLEHFYAEGIIFDGSMARCAWEVDVDLESDSDSSNHEEPVEAQDELKSFWSKDSDAEMDFTNHAGFGTVFILQCNMGCRIVHTVAVAVVNRASQDI